MKTMNLSTTSDGGYRLGAAPPAPAGVASLSLRGCLLVVDPATPDLPELHVLTDEGVDVAEELLGAVLPDPAAARSGEVRTRPAALLQDAVRLAIIRWLAIWTPFPLDPRLLALESGSHAIGLDDLIDWEASADLPNPEQATASAIIAARELTDANGSAPGLPGLPDLLVDMLTSAAAVGQEIPSGLVERLSTIIRQRDPRQKYQAATMLVAEPAGTLLGTQRPSEPVLPSGTASVDWSQVARGATGVQEEEVRWQVVDPGGAELTLRVTVPVGPAPGSEPGGLLARLWHEDAELPFAVVALSPTGSAWTGSGPVFIDPASGLLHRDGWWLDVTSADSPRRRRDRIERQAAEARRWAIRGVSAMRIGLSGGVTIDTTNPLREATGCFERARDVLQSLSFQDTDRVEIELAPLLERRVQVLNSVALGRLPDSYEVDEVLADLASGGGDAGLLAPPDLRHPAWRLTLAERGYLLPARA